MTEAEEVFEKGRAYLDENKGEEATKALYRAVQLDPQNLEYRVWLAQALNWVGNRTAAKEEAQRVLAVDPNNAKAYRQLGYAQKAEKNYEDALQSLSKAIELAPDIWQAYKHRAEIYDALGYLEAAIVDRAHYFELDPLRKPGEWSGQQRFQTWYQTIHKHLSDNLLSKLPAHQESFVGYWPCLLEWGKKSEVTSSNNAVFTMTYATYGSGYLCLTNKTVYLCSLGNISQKFPLYKQGLLPYVVRVGLGKQSRQMEKTDQFWSVPYDMVTGAQIVENNAIRIVTGAMVWEVFEHFTNQIQTIMAGLNAGLSGKFTQRDIPLSRSTITSNDNTNVIALLKELGELRRQGILSEADFEEKKRELLARL